MCAGVRSKRMTSAAPAVLRPWIHTVDPRGHGPRSSTPPLGCERSACTWTSTTVRPALVEARARQDRRP